MYTLFEGQAFRYCVLHMFRIPKKKRAFGQLTKLESYYYTKIKHHSLHTRVTVVLCNNNYPCTFVSPRFLSQVYWSMNILIDSWRFVNSKKSFISFSLLDYHCKTVKDAPLICAKSFVTPCAYNVCEKGVFVRGFAISSYF